jgi:hypothetical protein
MFRRAGVSLLGTALLLLAACGSEETTSTRVSAETTDRASALSEPFTHFVAPFPPSFTGPLTKARYYNSGQIEIAPPPPSMHLLTSPEDAFKTCWTEASCVANTSPEIVLALYTNRTFGQYQVDGSVLYPHQHVLAYVMTWQNVPLVAAGSSLSRGPAKEVSGDHVVFVDANSGRPLLAIDSAPFQE